MDKVAEALHTADGGNPVLLRLPQGAVFPGLRGWKVVQDFNQQPHAVNVRLTEVPSRVDMGVFLASLAHSLIQSLIRIPCPFNCMGNIDCSSHKSTGTSSCAVSNCIA